MLKYRYQKEESKMEKRAYLANFCTSSGTGYINSVEYDSRTKAIWHIKRTLKGNLTPYEKGRWVVWPKDKDFFTAEYDGEVERGEMINR